jgi:hypothetical protein
LKSLDIPWNLIVSDFYKDMTLLGWNIPIESFERGPEELRLLILQLLKQQPKAVRELLYRLGIPEDRLSHFFDQNVDNLSHSIVDLIQQRCKERILLRRHFS